MKDDQVYHIQTEIKRITSSKENLENIYYTEN